MYIAKSKQIIRAVDNSTMLAANPRYSAFRCSFTDNVNSAAILKYRGFSAQPSELSTSPKLLSKLRLLLLLFVATKHAARYFFRKKTIVLMLWVFVSLLGIARADDSSDASEDVKPLSQAEIDQFQSWLNNSKQHHADVVTVKKKKQPIYTTEVPALITKEGAYEDLPAVISPPLSYNQSQQLMLQSATT